MQTATKKESENLFPLKKNKKQVEMRRKDLALNGRRGAREWNSTGCLKKNGPAIKKNRKAKKGTSARSRKRSVLQNDREDKSI